MSSAQPIPHDSFPRSDDRGLIEAVANSNRALNLFGFPRSDDRGLIEAASFAGPARSRIKSFPRSDDRGLIEAMVSVIATPAAGKAHFRDLMIAASLKLDQHTQTPDGNLLFPRSDDRGLIEAVAPVSLAADTLAGFPRSDDRGLIEAAAGFG